ncbi:unnamed protein product [Leuciscus chuanchicus]
MLAQFLEQYPSETNDEFPHVKEEITRAHLTTKLKAIRGKYRNSVDTGRRSAPLLVVLLYFEQCEQVWGGSPATTTIASGIETNELEDSVSPSPATSASSLVEVLDAESEAEVQDVDGSVTITPTVKQRRDLLQHAQAALEGAACGHCESLSMRVLRSRLALFSEDGQMRAPRGSGPASAEAMRRLRSWGSQRELAEGIETAEAFSRSSSESSDSPIPRSGARPAASPARDVDPVLQLSDSEELDVLSIVEGDLNETQQSAQSVQSAPCYDELLEVVTRAVEKLDISWPQERQEERVRSKLDERFLQHRAQPPRLSLPFFSDLHNELCKSWNRPFSARLSNPPILK